MFTLSEEAERELRRFQIRLRKEKGKRFSMNDLIVEMIRECEVRLGFREHPAKR